MENSYDEECFKKWEIDECEAEMEKVVQWQKDKLWIREGVIL